MYQRTPGLPRAVLSSPRLLRAVLSWKWLWGLAVVQAVSLAGAADKPVLRLATTMSVVDSGLAAAILPDFERQNACRVDVIAVGTGQALSIAGRGDADVVIVHARKMEEEFIAAGHAKQRDEFMFNDFVLAGPADDPARAAGGKSAADAFRAIAAAGAAFFSRGDRSGTHAKELAVWSAAGLAPDRNAAWYHSLGLGTREVLLAANEKRAYTLTDRGTWLALQAKLPELRVIFGGDNPRANKDPELINRYAVIAVDSTAHPGINTALARRFAAWLQSPEIQRKIGQFGVSQFGQALFYPAVR
ncbi:MAG: substrate-binding domain-containing protein [Pirellulaceae bacterium]|nr:substrate-binding domain-containing protein [Pirellulaceae bacterium]